MRRVTNRSPLLVRLMGHLIVAMVPVGLFVEAAIGTPPLPSPRDIFQTKIVVVHSDGSRGPDRSDKYAKNAGLYLYSNDVIFVSFREQLPRHVHINAPLFARTWTLCTATTNPTGGATARFFGPPRCSSKSMDNTYDPGAAS